MWLGAKPKPDQELMELFEQAGLNVQRAAALFRDLLAEYPERAELAQEVLLCEREGDRIAHDILHKLALHARSYALDPVDVHALTGALDDIVDLAEEAADRLGLYGVEAPMEQAQQMSDVLVSASDEVVAALHSLRIGTDPSPQLVEIHRLENDADQLVRQGVASLFATGIDPMLVIRWKDIYETIEAAVDACETVANVLEGMSLKQLNGSH